MTVQVIDNLLSDKDFSELHAITVGNEELAWFPGVVLTQRTENIKNFQLVHTVFNNGEFVSGLNYAMNLLLDHLDMYLLVRCKLNLNPYCGDVQYEHGYHTDVTDLPKGLPVKTAVFYLNTNNGYTKFESTGEKVQSVANRLVTFDARERHTGSTATDVAARYVVNVNYIPT